MTVNRIPTPVRPGQNPLSPPVHQSPAMPAANFPAVWIGLMGGASPDVAAQQYLYRVAYERARQALEPPRHYRQLFSVWN